MHSKPEAKRLLPGSSGRIFKYLFMLCALCLAAACALGTVLLTQYRAAQDRETALAGQLGQMQARLTAQQGQLEQQLLELERLERRSAQLDEALSTIEELRASLHPAPDPLAPEYTKLYPDMYAQPWEGETVTGGQVVCLTFDDGPSAITDRILATLDQYGVKATFFVVGRTGERDQQRMRDIVAAGHTLGMHSWSHDYKKIYASVEAFLEDYYQLYQWIYQVTGSYPQIFRFPGGSINSYNRGIYQEIVAEMTRRGFVYFDWNASAQDATLNPLDPGVIRDNCLRGIGRDLVVVLNHDSSARGTTADALASVIEGYRNAGYTFLPLTPGVAPVTMDYPKPK